MILRLTFLCSALLILLTSSHFCEADDLELLKQFEEQVRPLLETRCLKCHGEKKQEGGLRLDSLEAILKGGESGPTIVRGEPDTSLLIEAVNYASFEMPPGGKLEDSEVAVLTAWVAAGAPWPESLRQLRAQDGIISPEDREWWAFQPLHKPPVPQVENQEWVQNPIDAFVLAKLNDKNIHPAPQADRVTLVRRLFFDVLGLPPTQTDIDHFVADDSPDAWERLVDCTLADSRYGEHWARFWLDLVRYAESDGWNQDAYRPHIWRYRDYVVRSFNADKPYPVFVREQLAGDEIPGDDPDHLIAAGFLRLGIYEYNQRDARTQWDNIVTEMTDVTGDVFLGLGMSCARCHDHKFDPLLQTDYFKLRAFFEPVIWRDDVTGARDDERAKYEEKLAAWKAASQEVQEKIDALLQPYFDRKWESTAEKFPLDIQTCFHTPQEKRTSWDEQMAYLIGRQFEEEGGGPLKNISKEDKEAYEALKKQLAEFDDLKPPPLPAVMTISDFAGEISPTVIPDDATKTPVDPGFPSVLNTDGYCGEISATPVSDSTGRRTALAAWIGHPENALTMRVIVNRIWQQHFGRGIAPTTSDFGHLGQLPSHPELLDWLAATFVANGESFKDLHRLILTSSTWQQSATNPRADEYEQIDPSEQLLWRAPVRRLSAEQIRDAMLFATGDLNNTQGGASNDSETLRRALYVKSLRNTPDEFLHPFDRANGLKSIGERIGTTTPTQSLLMMNGSFTIESATRLADRLLSNRSFSCETLVEDAIQRVWGRSPTPAERERALEFIGMDGTHTASTIERNRLIDFCHVLLSSNEFLYVE
ncbi:MAG: PSD1 domain-containing protein [Planctomycetaceae bacterium]|nr:PSD1 domain-containing protein [Planctomycetaceae bacterium]